MPRTRDCDYCEGDIEPGTGTMFVHKDGSTVHFCSSKCEKNADLGREARNLEWTDAGQDAKKPTRAEQAAADEAAASEAATESASGPDSSADESDDDETEQDAADDADEEDAGEAEA